MKVQNLREVCSGLLVTAIGGVFLAGSFQYDFGSAQNMGPGFFPFFLGCGTIAVGLLIALLSNRQIIDRTPIGWRDMASVSGAIALFGLLADRGGLLPAVISAVVLIAVVGKQLNMKQTALLAVGLLLGTWLIFSVGLGMPLHLIKGI